MRQNDFRSAAPVWAALSLLVLWLAAIAAYAYEDGMNLFQWMGRFSQVLERPFAIGWTPYTLKYMLGSLLLYGCGIALYYSSRENRRPGEEYGSAKWGSPKELNRKYMDHQHKDANIILTQRVRLGMDGYITQRNMNVLVVGGSGSGKTRFFCKPNIYSANCSYLITDPKGELLRAAGALLAAQGYEVRVFNLIDPSQSDGYNPFSYIHSEKDVLTLIDNLIKNTTPRNASSNDPFWEKAEIALDSALMLYLVSEAPPEEQNFEMLIYMMNFAEVREEDDQYRSPLDMLFRALEEEQPNHVAVKQYKAFKQAAGKTAKSILVSAAVRLATFNIPQYPGPTYVSVDGGKSFTADKLYFRNGETQCSADSANYNAYYDPTAGTLTLNGYDGGAIVLGGAEQGDLTIKLMGNNTIRSTTSQHGVAGNTASGSITITADSSSDTLTIDVSNSTSYVYGIDGNQRSVTISGSADVTIIAEAKSTDKLCFGINSLDTVSILGNASVDIKSKVPENNTGSNFCRGINGKKVAIETGGTIMIDVTAAGDAGADSYGVDTTSSTILTKVGEMQVKWKKGTFPYVGGAISRGGSFDINTHAVNVDKDNCFASYRFGTPRTVTVENGTFTGPGVPNATKYSGKFLENDMVSITPSEKRSSDGTLIPFKEWTAEGVTFDSPAATANNSFTVPGEDVTVTAKHSPFVGTPTFTPTDSTGTEGTLTFKTEVTAEMSMEASEPMMPDAWATTLWAMSNTPMTRFQVLVTSKIAAADLNTHLKIIQVSTSCRLLRSVIIWISSSVITMARITPAIGTMMELERFWIMLKMSPFQPCGVWPTCTDISATCWFTLSNIPVKFPMMPPTSISFSQLVRASNKKSIRCQTSFPPLPLCAGGGEDFSG